MSKAIVGRMPLSSTGATDRIYTVLGIVTQDDKCMIEKHRFMT